MKKSTSILLKILLATTLTLTSIYIFAPWQYVLHYLSPLPATIQQQADEAVEQGVAGIILYVDQEGAEPELYASGWHNRQDEVPAYPEALFKIASIGKLYDAAAVSSLVARGNLSLDRTLAEYLPSLAERIEYSDQITLRMMVQHTSGIPNFSDQEGFSWDGEGLDVWALMMDKPGLFEPGTDYAYSNSNYLLLARIMDEALGYPYGQFIKEELLQPLGISRTYFSMDGFDENELMSGYWLGSDTDYKYLDQGYVATAEDVGVFLRALNDGSLFSDRARDVYASLYEFEHTGWVLGYYSIARYHRDIDTVVIQFVNTNGGDTILLNDIVYGRVLKILRKRNST